MGKILSAILFLIALCPSAFAQAPEKLSTSEDVAIAFFKTGDVKPDFVKWARKSDKAAMVQKARERQYLEKEVGRLSGLWNAYNPAQSLLSVKTAVLVRLGSAADEKGEMSYTMKLAFQKGDADYFPFQFQDYAIAVIPQKLEDLFVQPIAPEQFQMLQSAFNGLTGKGSLTILLKPVKADLSQPYEMDNREQWMLSTDIAGMSLKTSQGRPLWDYSAPWYVTPTTRDVRDMFTKHIEQEQANDAAEGIAP